MQGCTVDFVWNPIDVFSFVAALNLSCFILADHLKHLCYVYLTHSQITCRTQREVMAREKVLSVVTLQLLGVAEMSVEVSVREMKLWSMPPNQALLACYRLIKPRSSRSPIAIAMTSIPAPWNFCTSHWMGPPEVLPVGSRTCSGRPCDNDINEPLQIPTVPRWKHRRWNVIKFYKVGDDEVNLVVDKPCIVP